MIKKIKNAFIESRDLTSGNMFVKVILFAIPTMLATMMNLLYVTIDLTTVHFGDSEDAVGAISSNSALINLIIVVFTGISIGANVLLSEAKGANNKDRANKVLHTSLVFGLITGIIIGLIGFFISDNLLVLMQTEAKLISMATKYLKIYFLGLPFLMLFNYSSQILRSQGDSRTPFYALAISGLINIGFDLLFVLVFKLSVAGVAYATIIAEGVSALICILVLKFGKKNYVNLSFKNLKVDLPTLKSLIKIGLPSGLQGFFFSLPNVFVQANLYTIDPNNIQLVNGAAACGHVEHYFYAGVEAISTAVMTIIAANLGAKNKENIKKAIYSGLIWGSIYCVILVIITAFLSKQVLSIFVDSDSAIYYGQIRLSIMGYFYILDFTMIYTAAVLRGVKKPIYPMLTTFIFCTALRIILLLTLFRIDKFHNMYFLYAIYPISWIFATISNIIALIVVKPKVINNINNVNNNNTQVEQE